MFLVELCGAGWEPYLEIEQIWNLKSEHCLLLDLSRWTEENDLKDKPIELKSLNRTAFDVQYLSYRIPAFPVIYWQYTISSINSPFFHYWEFISINTKLLDSHYLKRVSGFYSSSVIWISIKKSVFRFSCIFVK